MKLNEIKEPRTIAVHDFSKENAEGGSAAYDRTQTDDAIKDGDVLHLGGDKTAIMVQAWPVEVTGKHPESNGFHKKQNHVSWDDFSGGKYKDSIAKARAVAAKHS